MAQFEDLRHSINGELFTDNVHKTIYATDASAYREFPAAVLIPANTRDIKQAILFATEKKLSIIPRTAGTSIAGQVVGNGLVIDCSKHLNKILEINQTQKWVRVEPGVVLDELNKELEPLGLFFGPETSTSNRCMLGGMVGNNSCGAHSIVYGSTRDHVLEIKGFLSNGSEVVFKELTNDEFEEKCELETLEGKIYRQVKDLFSQEELRTNIQNEFPDPDIKRRNTGYAIDIISQMQPFNSKGKPFNMCSLLAGSEGTLAFTTEIKLNLVLLPPKQKGLLVVHHASLEESFEANVVALKFCPVAVELIDKFLLDCTINSPEHSKNRFFLQGNPQALLCVEFAEQSEDAILQKSNALIAAFKEKGYGFHYPLLFGADINKVWALRKAGLGLLSNIPGDAKPQPVIEDTAVSPRKLHDYICEFNKVLEQNKLTCVYYAHIATGELHLRPVLNLKEEHGIKMFRLVAAEIARLVKKYNGSLSGEHGDGRLRGEFIPYMIGEKNFQVLKEIKSTWDPDGVFNKGKITDTPPMDTSLRFYAGQQTPDFNTILDFSDTLGYIRMAEKCNGSADCRKSAIIGGVMCPSYQATRDEQNTTRARANMLREAINSSNKANRFDNQELYDILDLCLSCKGCKAECPSGVDMAMLKSEFLYQYYKSNRVPIRSRLIASFGKTQQLASKLALVYNGLNRFYPTAQPIKRLIGFAPKRNLPKVHFRSWKWWLKRNIIRLNNELIVEKGQVCFFIDEFINYNEPYIGITAVKLLNKLGYKIVYIKHHESGRAKISKGFLKAAQKLAEKNVKVFTGKIGEHCALVGVEPSAILTFRDEYPGLLRGEVQALSRELTKNVFTIEEFIANEFSKGNITADKFRSSTNKILYHGHCQQKSLTGTSAALKVLGIPGNGGVEEIKSGCCGMAGSFGFEKEHFGLSMKIGELILFPKVRKAGSNDSIVASGTSCRQHIKDGTGKDTKHPVEVLYSLLSVNS
ncbi:MAG: FAD-binding protein [Bacteroidales bacterium]|nr:FAD-binding protein [Bacteroidales bacterium]